MKESEHRAGAALAIFVKAEAQVDSKKNTGECTSERPSCLLTPLLLSSMEDKATRTGAALWKTCEPDFRTNSTCSTSSSSINVLVHPQCPRPFESTDGIKHLPTFPSKYPLSSTWSSQYHPRFAHPSSSVLQLFQSGNSNRVAVLHRSEDPAFSSSNERQSAGDSQSEEDSSLGSPAKEESLLSCTLVLSDDGNCTFMNTRNAAANVSQSTQERLDSLATNVYKDVMQRLEALKTLKVQGFIDTEELQRRKDNVIGHVSGQHFKPCPKPRVRSLKLSAGCPPIVQHPPDFYNIPEEKALKHVFNYETRQWECTEVMVKLDEQPFAKGSLRIVCYLQEQSEGDVHNMIYVAKLAIDPDEDPETYFKDIELQAHCASYALLYNEYKPPKKVEFVKAWVLELTQREGALCAVERYIPGSYLKHNNNYGCVSDEERNTPQAFSHFTYEASKHQLLAVDIQGVGDLYTDPQIHTLNGNDFGKGNLGVIGFKKFFDTHRCNPICRYLKLPSFNPKDERCDAGTIPVQKLMHIESIRSVQFESKHYYENAPMLKKYIAECRDAEFTYPRSRGRPFSSLCPKSTSSCCGIRAPAACIIS